MTDIFKRRLKPSGDAAESPVGDEIVILHLKQGVYYGLDVVGSRVWALLKQGMAGDEICRTLQDEFEAPADAVEADVRRFLSELAAKDMVVDV